MLVELLIPLALSRRPWLGIALVVGLHGGITLLMPGILPFGVLMLAMSVVYLVPLRATAPAAAPITDTLPLCAYEARTHVSVAAAAAVLVTSSAFAA